jgi:hypothetical protein
MKKIIYILITFMVCSVNLYAQNVFPLDDYWKLDRETIRKNKGYIKDINNSLDKYVGAWTGTYKTNQFQFFIKKTTEEDTEDYHKEDVLVIHHIIKSANGTVLEDNTAKPDFEYGNSTVINGMYPSEYGKMYVLSYWGKYPHCGQQGSIFIYSISPTSMSLELAPQGDLIDIEGCPDQTIGQIMPTEKMILTRVTYTNTVKSVSFNRNNCGKGYTGSSVVYTVPAGKYTSTISQADADAQAQAEVNANGQNNANNQGTCKKGNVKVIVPEE